MDKKELSGWIARDKDYMLHFFLSKPTRYEDLGEWASGGERYLIPGELANIYWGDEPRKVKISLTEIV